MDALPLLCQTSPAVYESFIPHPGRPAMHTRPSVTRPLATRPFATRMPPVAEVGDVLPFQAAEPDNQTQTHLDAGRPRTCVLGTSGATDVGPFAADVGAVFE